MKISSPTLRDCLQSDTIYALATRGTPTPDSDDTPNDGRANVYTRMFTLIGLSMHSCALHHRGREVPPGRTTKPS